MERPLHRRAGRRPALAAGRPVPRRNGAADAALPAGRLPPTPNLDIPNEDARAVDLEDLNLFALNRFRLRPLGGRRSRHLRRRLGRDLRGLAFRTNIGQSYRLSTRETILPSGTGLSGRFLDFVGEPACPRPPRQLRPPFRVDKDNLAIRRNEVDATVADAKPTSRSAICASTATSTPRSRICAIARRCAPAAAGALRYWSLFGSAVIDLTNRNEDP